MMKPVNLIVAVDEEGGFSKDGKIPWDIKEDMAFFKKTTTGSVCVMGRRTYTDMLTYKDEAVVDAEDFVLLPNRDSFVLTRNEEFDAKGSRRAKSLSEVFHICKKDKELAEKEIFILGGYQLFIEAMNYPNYIYMTVIKNANYKCNIKFPIHLLSNYDIIDGSETELCYYLKYKLRGIT